MDERKAWRRMVAGEERIFIKIPGAEWLLTRAEAEAHVIAILAALGSPTVGKTAEEWAMIADDCYGGGKSEAVMCPSCFVDVIRKAQREAHREGMERAAKIADAIADDWDGENGENGEKVRLCHSIADEIRRAPAKEGA